MQRHLRNRFRTLCLVQATLLALTGNVWSQNVADDSRFNLAAAIGFATMDAKGDVLVDDANGPAKLVFDLKSTFRLGPNSNGINPLAEGLTGELEYAGSVTPCLIVSVAAGCFTQTGNGYRVTMQDIHNCGVSVKLLNASGPNEILPFVELLPAVDKFDLRLTPGPNGLWDMKLNIDFFASIPNGPLAAVLALLRSPTTVKLAIGDDTGEVNTGRIEFKGAN